ncbi:fibroblast growth factor 9 isoform X2 [Rhipicephalus sanguineus]|uniref:fibroblast growth factor 9 isoform X2 n=1 Tax=Rhipicephalus sanguineus TaxID=34632 RepID=UPI001892DA07|nr:fibroblast growth factor 9 isoform X2 [Rhipicephalus sanguineus]
MEEEEHRQDDDKQEEAELAREASTEPSTGDATAASDGGVPDGSNSSRACGSRWSPSRLVGEASAIWSNMARFRPAFLGGRDDNLPDHLGPVKQLFCRTGHNLAVFPAGTVYGTREAYNRYEAAEGVDLEERVEDGDVEEDAEPVGVVHGTQEHFAENAILELLSHDIGQVRIRGVETGLFVCMDAEGRVYAKNRMDEEGIFYEMYEGGYNLYLSKLNKDKGWYLGIKKSGVPKPGPRTARGQKAVQFLPRAAKPRS